MDTLFVLGHESRLRILQRAAARVPGCAYLCVWAALPASSQLPAAAAAAAASSSSPAATSGRLLCCVDAWLCDGGGASCRGDAAAARRVRALFDAYRGSLCAAVSGCVPGWAYKDGRAFMELPANDLTASASLPVQQQFYEEAGIEMAAFMGCESGEIEVGMSTTASGGSAMSLESSLHQVFSEDFFQQSLLEELLQLPPTRPSSSPSSSLPSVSVGSPAAEGSTSMLRTMPVTPPPVTTPSSSGPERQAPALHHPLHHPRLPLASPFSRHGGRVHFPSPDADDAAMAEAMLVVISASSSSALPTTTTHPSTSGAAPSPGNHHGARRWPRRRGTTSATAFRAYNAALAPRVPWRPPGAPGQRMIKMGISILRRMHMLRFSRERTAGVATATMAQQAQEEEEDPPAAPSSSQLNHMISERRRRERLNESFEALRGLLPPGSKKDKATVLAKTLDYMNILVSQIADLEARNRSLESRAHRHVNGGGGGCWKERPYYSSSEQQEVVVLQGLCGGTSERVQVQVTTAAASGASTSSSSSSAAAGREVAVRVEALAAHGDVAELVSRALAVIKGMGSFTVVAVDARRRPGDGSAHAIFTLRATAGEFDEASLREAVTKAAEESATPAPPPDDDL